MEWIQALDEELDELNADRLFESAEIDAEIFYAKWLTSTKENNPSLEAVMRLERMLPVEGNTSGSLCRCCLNDTWFEDGEGTSNDSLGLGNR